jgi:membrane-associated phospholipid phosphatase
MTAWDQAIPFVPQTVWVYVSEYIYFIVIYALCRETLNMNRYVYAVLAIQFVSVAIFWAWPTTYPRHLFPLPDTLDPLTHQLFTSLREGDSPNNCAPSLHVSSVLLCAFLFFNEQREKLWFFLTWGTLISLSTLTTKQHYIVDVVSGLMMAILFHWIFYRRMAYHEPRTAREPARVAS